MSLDSDYSKWQSQFQPEENGRVQGSEGIPGDKESVSDWEERVCEATGAAVEKIRQAFHSTEQALSRQFDHVVASYRQHHQAYRERSDALSRGVDIPVSDRWNKILTALIVVASAFFLSLLMGHVFDGIALSVATGSFLAAGLCVASYLAGIVLRQSQQLLYRYAALAGLVLALVFLMWIGIGATGANAGREAVMLAAIASVLVTVATPLVAALSRDPDASLERLWTQYRKDLEQAARLKAQREENQRLAQSRAQQVVHNGRRTIRVYRDTNSRYRSKVGKAEPAFFNNDPDIPNITQDDFSLDDDNNYEVRT